MSDYPDSVYGVPARFPTSTTVPLLFPDGEEVEVIVPLMAQMNAGQLSFTLDTEPIREVIAGRRLAGRRV